jgi:hypothetical protein
MGVDLPLKALCGERIVQIGTKQIDASGFERVVLRTQSNANYEFKAREVDGEFRDSYTEEFYTLDMYAIDESTIYGSGSLEVYDYDFPIGRVERLCRDEWTVPVEAFPAMIGVNPRVVCSGFVGAAPSRSVPVTVTSGVVLYHARTDDALLIMHTDFPGLLMLCSRREVIDDFRVEQSVEETLT